MAGTVNNNQNFNNPNPNYNSDRGHYYNELRTDYAKRLKYALVLADEFQRQLYESSENAEKILSEFNAHDTKLTDEEYNRLADALSHHFETTFNSMNAYDKNEHLKTQREKLKESKKAIDTEHDYRIAELDSLLSQNLISHAQYTQKKSELDSKYAADSSKIASSISANMSQLTDASQINASAIEEAKKNLGDEQEKWMISASNRELSRIQAKNISSMPQSQYDTTSMSNREKREAQRNDQKESLQLKRQEINELKAHRLQLIKNGASVDDLKDINKEIYDSEEELSEDEKKSENPTYLGKIENISDLTSAFSMDNLTGVFDDALDKIGDTLSKLGSNILSGEWATKAFNDAEEVQKSVAPAANAALMGSGKTYDEISGNLSNALMFNGLVQTQDVLKSVGEIVKSGVVSNVEQRAFLSNITDKVAETFEVLNDTLLHLNRVQREDSTMARLGLEVTLKEFLNQNYLDSEYLTDAFDEVSTQLFEASSIMTTESAAEFEYTTQKWLGSLYSVGMDKNTITSIASGINMLATGDVSGLSSNTSMQTLLAISANRANLDYAELLKNGLDESNVNDLLKAMVEYLGSIAESASNNVTASAYADIFNLSLTDLQAVSNLMSQTETIYKDSLSYSQMENKALYEASTGATSRTNISALLQNIANNSVYSAAEDLVTNPITYVLWKVLDAVESISGGGEFSIEYAPLGIGLELTGSITGLAKSAIMGTALIQNIASSAVNVLNSLTTSAQDYLNYSEDGESTTNQSSVNRVSTIAMIQNYNDTEMTGTGSFLQDAVGTSTSKTYNIAGNINTEDIEEDTLISNKKKVKNLKKKSYQEEEEEEEEEDASTYDTTDIYKGLFKSEVSGQLTTIGEHTLLQKTFIENVFDSERKSMNVVITGLGTDLPNGLPTYYSDEGKSQMQTYSDRNAEGFVNISEDLYRVSLGGDSAFNVNLTGSDIKLYDMVTGESTIKGLNSKRLTSLGSEFLNGSNGR